MKTLRVWAGTPRRPPPAPLEPPLSLYRPALRGAHHVGFFDPQPNAEGTMMAWMGTAASVRILNPRAGTLRISGEYDLECHRRAGGALETALRVSVDGKSIGVLRLRWHGPFEKTLRFPECPPSKAVALAFDASQGFIPAQIGIGGDARKLVLRIARVELNDTVILDFTRPGDPFMPDAHAEPRQGGINIVGYLQSEMGLGESARLCAASAEAACVEYSLVDFNIGCSSRAADTRFAHAISGENPHPVNVFHINPPELPLAFSHLGRTFFDNRYNIAFWHWELPELPDEWTSSFAFLNEVWVPSQFVMNTVSEKSPIPVIRMPHAVGFSVPKGLSRRSMALPIRKFLFLMMYDMHSSQTRKNPQAAVDAFCKAFPRPTGVALVVKTMNTESYPDEWAELEKTLSGTPGIVIINRTLTRQEVYNLEALCDCFVSLHRSEGFGLGLAESMYLGKPAIGTNWSGNVDFMNQKNSCPVDYALVELKRDYGHYKKGQHWAEPDCEHAAWYMKRLVSDAPFRKKIAKAGQATLRTEFSHKAVGERYRRRLELISRLL